MKKYIVIALILSSMLLMGRGQTLQDVANDIKKCEDNGLVAVFRSSDGIISNVRCAAISRENYNLEMSLSEVVDNIEKCSDMGYSPEYMYGYECSTGRGCYKTDARKYVENIACNVD